jgi:hypothetical protein
MAKQPRFIVKKHSSVETNQSVAQQVEKLIQ